MQPQQTLTKAQSQQLDAALALFRKGAFGDALAIAGRLAEEAPFATDALHLTALCLLRTGDPAAAEQAFRRALAQAPNHPHVLANFATFLRRFGRQEEAVPLWRRAVIAAPQHAQAWLDLGLTELELERLPQARTALERAVALQPESAMAWHGLGALHRAADDLPAAEAALRKAVSLDPGSASAWINLGAVSRLQGRPAQALECYERARQAGHDGPELTDAIAGALLDLGRVEEAIARAREVTARHPRFVPGHLTLAHLLWEHGSPLTPEEDPLAGFDAAVRAQPDNEALQLSYVGFLIEARQAERALERIHALRARSGQPHPVLLRLEADALERLGRADQAGVLYAQLYREGGRRDPSLLNAYTRHLLKAGQWDAAAVRAIETTALDPRNQEAWAYLGTAWRLLDDPREHWLCDYERLVGMVEVEPPPGYADLETFLTDLSAVLAPMHRAVREPVQQSLRGGSQTPGRLFGRPDPVIAATEQAMRRAVERWLASLPADPAHPFLRHRARSVRFTGSWSVKLWSSGRHVNHIHPQGWMSSAFYVALPPSVRSPQGGDPHAGHIQFGQPPLELGLGLPPRRVLQPQPGRLALFPSYLWHGTVPFEDTEPRVTIAFDMVPSGPVA
ncbi:tetratricopeptide repeat protein [Vulcaniibacterium gelatinicum]|uniref:tetratricopeptide repeat protein n=1 Tax=Vulcaniibacterium gelatinicum TaxID=2598725 RepID=UPI0015F2E363|nr:tetratricopeptide repeat protein [Vulcaniibacterium gelatinicum]